MEARIIVISPSSGITPNQLMILASSYGESVQLKETCFGLMVQGETVVVRRVIRQLRMKYPFSFFSKERGFNIGEKGKCRIGHRGGLSGGPRPGFYQLEAESLLLDNVGKALEAVENGEKGIVEKEKERLDEETVRCMINAIFMNS